MWKTLAAIVLFSLACSHASACSGPNLLFDDDFTEADPAWDVYEAVEIGKGNLRISAKQSGGAATLYGGGLFDPADICVEVTMPSAKDPSATLAGIVFAAQNYSGFYNFWISPVGTVGVMRRVSDRWLHPVPGRKVEGINTRPGSTNRLRVTLDGTRASLYVNERKVVDFKVIPTKGSGLIGLRSESEPDQPNAWVFTNLKVTDVVK